MVLHNELNTIQKVELHLQIFPARSRLFHSVDPVVDNDPLT